MSPHDLQVAIVAWLAALSAVVVAVGATWAAIYPTIAKIKADIDALWTVHRASTKEQNDGKSTGLGEGGGG